MHTDESRVWELAPRREKCLPVCDEKKNLATDAHGCTRIRKTGFIRVNPRPSVAQIVFLVVKKGAYESDR